MAESGEVPSGNVYRQLFDAQVQLSRSLLGRQGALRTTCLSAQDSNTHSSTASRRLCYSSSRGPQLSDDDVSESADIIDDITITLVVERTSSDIIKRLTEKRQKKHEEALELLDTELTVLSELCEIQIKTSCLDLVSSLEEVDHRLDTLKARMEHTEHFSLQEVYGLWEEVQQEVQQRKNRIRELNNKLIDQEAERGDRVRALLKKYCRLLEKISFMPLPDIHSQIHSDVTMVNQALLANRHSIARLVRRLLEENLHREALLHLYWEDWRSKWRRSRVNQVIDGFRKGMNGEAELVFVHQTVDQMRRVQQEMTQQRCDIIGKLCSLTPPTCSTALVSDWFNQLTAVNHQIDCLHVDSMQQMRCFYEQRWQGHLTEMEHCKVALSALELSEEEVQDVIKSQLLPLIGRCQSQAEDRLAAFDAGFDSLARTALSISRLVFVLMRGAASLWETHSCSVQRREEELERRLDDLRHTQEEEIQRKKLQLNVRQECSEEEVKSSVEKTVLYLQEVTESCRQCVSEQLDVLDCFPSVLLEELHTYSSSLSNFFHLSNTFSPSPEELKNTYPSITLVWSGGAEMTLEEKMTEKRPISFENDPEPAQASQDWLAEADSSVMDLCDLSRSVTFTSSGGGAYSGPAFRCPAPKHLNGLEQETELVQFPAELLTHTLSRVRSLVFDHLEQRFLDVLSLAVTMVTDRKEAVLLNHDLQLQQLNPQHMQTHIYNPRLAELQLHRQCVDAHCQEVLDTLFSCRMALQELQSSISRKDQEFVLTVSNMEDDALRADSSRCLDSLSSTLQDCEDHHIKQTLLSLSSFRQSVSDKLDQLRNKTTRLLRSFKLFSEGGGFAREEVEMFHRRLREETKRINVTQESVHADLMISESKSLQQVKEVSGRCEEKLSHLKVEVSFMEKIQKLMSKTQVQLKAEAACSDQQEAVISSRLDELREMMENIQVSPDEVLSLLSSLSVDLRSRCQYLHCFLNPSLAAPVPQHPLQGSFALATRPKSRKQEGLTLSPDSLQLSRVGVAQTDDAVVGGAEYINRRGCSSIRTDRRFQVFGSKLESEQNTQSFCSLVDSILWMACDILLLVAEDFYTSVRRSISRFHFLPDTLDQWAESMKRRLLGYQEQARSSQTRSTKKFGDQLSVLEKLLHSLPAVLISNHEQQQEVGLNEEVGGIRLMLKEMIAASEKEKSRLLAELRVSLRQDELHDLNSRELLRQQQLHSDICCSHQQIQACVRARGERFVRSLASLTENFLFQLDQLLTPTETVLQQSAGLSEDCAVTMETTGQHPCTDNRTWPGISYLSPPSECVTALPSPVTMATTPSITTAKFTVGHQAVIKQRDAAVKRFEQLYRSEFLRSDADRRRQLSEQQRWNTHWQRQIHTLTH